MRKTHSSNHIHLIVYFTNQIERQIAISISKHDQYQFIFFYCISELMIEKKQNQTKTINKTENLKRLYVICIVVGFFS